MAEKILTLVDHSAGRVRRIGWEALRLGQRLSGELGRPLVAVVIGKGARAAAEEVARKKLEEVWLVDHPLLDPFTADSYSAALRQIIEADKPFAVLLGHTYQNIDYVSRVAEAVGSGYVTDAIDLRMESGKMVVTKQAFRSKLNVEIGFEAPPPYFVSLQAGAFSSDGLEEGGAEVVEKKIALAPDLIRRKVLEVFEAVKGKVDLSKSEFIVAVGRGIGKAENLPIIEEFARVLGAQVGASRPVIDMEWLPRDRQIGSSGQTVAPRVYFAVGISGAIQHLVGMKNSGVIVAINRDANAPIFSVATYGIVGDLFEVVPALTELIKREKGIA